jgi:CheY-like chemotaxis protein
MLARLLGEDIHVRTTFADPLRRVKVDPGQIEQVLMNLAVNARDAMPQGGELTIETANVNLDASFFVEYAEARPGPYVLLTVSDTGVGMDAETRSHLFEPFFTTKDVGKGTGLGLAMVYGIVKQSEGFIRASSEPGKGATFTVYLPGYEEQVPPTQPVGLPHVPKGTETVLLAEDEQSVRQLTRFALEKSGYTVLAAANGAEALAALHRHPGPIQLLVTDVVMPTMSGRQLAEAVRLIFPEVKVLYLSGHTDDAVVRHGIQEKGVAFLQKPFTPTALGHKIREVLDQKNPQAK